MHGEEIEAMNLFDYIKGEREGKEAHRIEKESMKDTFLSEAIDGFDTVEANHIQNIEKLYKTIDEYKTRKKLPYNKIAVACLALLVFGSALFLVNKPMHLQANEHMTMINIYVPIDEYRENIAMIAQNNSEQAIQYRDEIKVDRLDAKFVNQLSEDKFLAEENNPIDIFLPLEKIEAKPSTAITTPPQQATKNKANSIILAQAKSIGQSDRKETKRQNSDIKIVEMVMADMAAPEMIEDIEKVEMQEELVVAFGYPKKKEVLDKSLADTGTVSKNLASSATRDIAAIEAKSYKIEKANAEIGNDSYIAYLKANLVFELLDSSLPKIEAKFDIDANGKPQNIKVDSRSSKFNQSLIELIEEGSRWSPKNGKAKIVIKL